jgi:hypothetical protein
VAVRFTAIGSCASGCHAGYAPKETIVMGSPEPSTGKSKLESILCSPHRDETKVNAIQAPSGDQAGLIAILPRVSCVSSDPSGCTE